MSDIHLGRGHNNDDFATITIRNSKTAQFNEGDYKTLNAVDGPVFPVETLALLVTLRNWPSESEEKVFG